MAGDGGANRPPGLAGGLPHPPEPGVQAAAPSSPKCLGFSEAPPPSAGLTLPSAQTNPVLPQKTLRLHNAAKPSAQDPTCANPQLILVPQATAQANHSATFLAPQAPTAQAPAIASVVNPPPVLAPQANAPAANPLVPRAPTVRNPPSSHPSSNTQPAPPHIPTPEIVNSSTYTPAQTSHAASAIVEKPLQLSMQNQSGRPVQPLVQPVQPAQPAMHQPVPPMQEPVQPALSDAQPVQPLVHLVQPAQMTLQPLVHQPINQLMHQQAHQPMIQTVQQPSNLPKAQPTLAQPIQPDQNTNHLHLPVQQAHHPVQPNVNLCPLSSP
ncbi:hypothetical protein LIER_43996 [Lithospermum erythrorhizon]|uniref:Uncharacterized protein n=1 Tax=Lithospermum erythrorhizon TaxID=34254 RepID=A0AAV3RFV5_LITER